MQILDLLASLVISRLCTVVISGFCTARSTWLSADSAQLGLLVNGGGDVAGPQNSQTLKDKSIIMYSS